MTKHEQAFAELRMETNATVMLIHLSGIGTLIGLMILILFLV